nr:hypothetical protein [uncultured Treponema sp.]
MLKNTAFQDNLYQLAKIITITDEGLTLDLSTDMFLEKIISDISFVSQALQTIFTETQNLSHLPEYLPIMHSLHACETDFLLLLRNFAARTLEKQLELPISAADLSTYYKMHSSIKEQIGTSVQENGKSLDAYHIVSKNELTELLCV